MRKGKRVRDSESGSERWSGFIISSGSVILSEAEDGGGNVIRGGRQRRKRKQNRQCNQKQKMEAAV